MRFSGIMDDLHAIASLNTQIAKERLHTVYQAITIHGESDAIA